MRHYRLIERIVHGEVKADPTSPIALYYEMESYDSPDHDLIGVLARVPTGRVLIIIEGEKNVVAPIAARASEVLLAHQMAESL